jgi:AcrR family transcriptional regulator
MIYMPKISAATVVEHREQRRTQLLDAAAMLIVRDDTFTMAQVAAEVGLSRSAVYEYYSSAADLIADVLVDELAEWASSLERVTSTVNDPVEQVRAWTTAVLNYAAAGRHALVRAAGAVDLPPSRRVEVQTMHRSLIAPLFAAVAAMGDVDPGQLARYVWGVVDVSIARIEAGECDTDDEIATVLEFVEGGLVRSIAARN